MAIDQKFLHAKKNLRNAAGEGLVELIEQVLSAFACLPRTEVVNMGEIDNFILSKCRPIDDIMSLYHFRCTALGQFACGCRWGEETLVRATGTVD